MSIESEIAEAFTGIQQRGALRFFHKEQQNTPLTVERATEIIHDGGVVEVPAAGAGSYEEVIGILGLGRAELAECSSSAGDWLIRLPDKEDHFVVQANRYPHYGFSYTLLRDSRTWREGGRR